MNCSNFIQTFSFHFEPIFVLTENAELQDVDHADDDDVMTVNAVTRRSEECDCNRHRRHHHHHQLHHYRHRCRRRTSSCERVEIIQRDTERPDYANKNICRSKSNVEICLFRRRQRRSKGHREAYSSSTESDGVCSDFDGSSSSSYCRCASRGTRRKRDNQRRKEKSAEQMVDAESDQQRKDKNAMKKGKATTAASGRKEKQGTATEKSTTGKSYFELLIREFHKYLFDVFDFFFHLSIRRKNERR